MGRHRNLRRITAFIVTITAALFLVTAAGCSWFGEKAGSPPVKEGSNDAGRADGQTGTGAVPGSQAGLPPEIAAWVEQSRTIYAGQARALGGKLYILVTYGEKPTGGYSVEITEVVPLKDHVRVKARFTAPGPDQLVTQAFTYPYDLEVIEDPGLPVRFEAEGAETHLMSLMGIDVLPPIAAGSDWIKVFAPRPGESVRNSFTMSGIASVFEGTVTYEVIDPTGQVVASGFTTAAMGDWGYFEERISLPADAGRGPVTLELYSESAEDGSRMFKVSIPLQVVR